MVDSLSMIGRLWTRVLALAVVLAAPLAVHAQAYPSKTLRLILPFPPSGGTDTLGRGIAQTLSAQIGSGSNLHRRRHPMATPWSCLRRSSPSAPCSMPSSTTIRIRILRR
jgi:hypothetical protein